MISLWQEWFQFYTVVPWWNVVWLGG